MFSRLKSFFSRERTLNAPSPTPVPMPVSPMPPQEAITSRDEFTFESLWNDYEKRSWPVDNGGKKDRLYHWIGSISSSGYTREECLLALIAHYEPGDENRILLRLADWVPQIQKIAAEWILQRFKTLPLKAILDNQKLLIYLSRKEHLKKHRAMQEIICDLLERAGAMDRAQFLGLSAAFRRFLLIQSLAGDGLLRPRMLDDPDPMNRLQLLREVKYTDLSEREITRLEADGSTSIVRRLLYMQIDAGVIPPRDRLSNLALHHQRMLRILGRFYLRHFYGENAYEIYRTRTGEEFYYIADYGLKEDYEHFIQGIRTGSAATRWNCLRALTAVAPERLGELDLAPLISSNAAIRRLLLPKLHRVLSLEEIYTLRPALESSSPGGLVSFVRLVARKSFWAFVEEGLRLLLAEPSPELEQEILRIIANKTCIPETLPADRRGRISDLVSQLQSDPRKARKSQAASISFILRNA